VEEPEETFDPADPIRTKTDLNVSSVAGKISSESTDSGTTRKQSFGLAVEASPEQSPALQEAVRELGRKHGFHTQGEIEATTDGKKNPDKRKKIWKVTWEDGSKDPEVYTFKQAQAKIQGELDHSMEQIKAYRDGEPLQPGTQFSGGEPETATVEEIKAFNRKTFLGKIQGRTLNKSRRKLQFKTKNGTELLGTYYEDRSWFTSKTGKDKDNPWDVFHTDSGLRITALKSKGEVEDFLKMVQASGLRWVGARNVDEFDKMIPGGIDQLKQMVKFFKADGDIPTFVDPNSGFADRAPEAGVLADAGSETPIEYGHNPKTDDRRTRNSFGLQGPELLRLTKALMGGKLNVIARKLPNGLNGYFKPDADAPSIVINLDLASRGDLGAQEVAKTLAHEIGHLIDLLNKNGIPPNEPLLEKLSMMKSSWAGVMESFKGAPGPISVDEAARIMEEVRSLNWKNEADVDAEIQDELNLTPADILSVWNSIIPNIKNESILNYIKGLSTKQKKSVIKSAMRGEVDSDIQSFVAALSGEVESKPGDPIFDKFQERIEAELKRRGILHEKTIFEELINLSEWWRPYNKTHATRKYIDYRESTRELWADAFSVLLNSPEELMARAPEFYRGLINYSIDSGKESFWDTYGRIMDEIESGPDGLGEARSKDIRNGFKRGADAIRNYVNKMMEWRNAENKSVVARMLQMFYFSGYRTSVFEGEIEKKTGVKIPIDQKASVALEELANTKGKTYDLGTRVDRDVWRPLEEQGLTQDDLGEYLVLRRIINERRDIPNPWNYTTKSAQPQMDYLKGQYGPEKFAALERHMQKFDDIIFEYLEQAVELGTFNRGLFEETIRPNRGSYATWQVVDYINSDGIPATVRKQVGTFKEVSNPFHATLMKTVSLIRLNDLQRVKRKTVDMINQFAPDEAPKRTALGVGKFKRSAPTPEPGKDNLIVLENGAPVAYEVDAYIKESIDKIPMDDMNRIIKWMGSKAYRIFHPLYVAFSPAFAIRNLQRDLRRKWKNLAAIVNAGKKFGDPSKIGVLDVLKAYYNNMGKAKEFATRTLGHASGVDRFRRRVFGKALPTAKHDQLLDEMVRQGALNTPFVRYNPTEEQEIYESTLLKLGVRPDGTEVDDSTWAWKAMNKVTLGAWGKIMGPVVESVEHFNATLEALPKIGGYQILTDAGFSGTERAYIVRNYVGTPNFARKGTHTAVSNSILMYSNVAIQGYAADAKIATDPSTRFGWLWRHALVDSVPKLIMRGAAMGLLGEFMKDFFEAIPEHDKRRYTIIPIGWQDSKQNIHGVLSDEELDGGRYKPIYMRLPSNETDAFLNGILWDVSGAESGSEVFGDVIAAIVDTFPQRNPILKMTSAGAQIVANQNPWDPFRRRYIVTQNAWDAGFDARAGEYMGWVMDQFGIFSQVTYGIRKESRSNGDGAMIRTIGSIPGAEAIFKTSDFGIDEIGNEAVKELKRENARFKRSLPAKAQRLTKKRYVLIMRNTAGPLPPHQAKELALLKRLYKDVYLNYTKYIKAAENEGNQELADTYRKRLADILDRYDF
jgi:hypothetical protein